MLFKKEIARKIALFSLSALIVLLCSCSPTKKLNKILLKHPELLEIDTTFINIDNFTTGYKYDSIFLLNNKTDTFKIEKENINIYLYKKNDSLKVNAEIKPQKISYKLPLYKYYYKTTKDEKITLKQKLKQKTKTINIIILIVVIILAIDTAYYK